MSERTTPPDRMTDDIPVTVSPGDWTTSPDMMELLTETDLETYNQRIKDQVTEDELAKMTPEQIQTAHAEHRMDRLTWERGQR